MSAESPEPTFEQITARLEEIALLLEGGEIELERALALFEEGVCLTNLGTKRLDEAERRVEVLLENGETRDFAPGPGEKAPT